MKNYKKYNYLLLQLGEACVNIHLQTKNMHERMNAMFFEKEGYDPRVAEYNDWFLGELEKRGVDTEHMAYLPATPGVYGEWRGYDTDEEIIHPGLCVAKPFMGDLYVCRYYERAYERALYLTEEEKEKYPRGYLEYEDYVAENWVPATRQDIITYGGLMPGLEDPESEYQFVWLEPADYDDRWWWMREHGQTSTSTSDYNRWRNTLDYVMP